MHILLSGAHGFIGKQLRYYLSNLGHEITAYPREGFNTFPKKPFKVAINLAGSSVFEGPWNQKNKDLILNSRIHTTRRLVDNLYTYTPEALLISASALGYYGHRPNEILTESSKKGDGFLSDVCESWEYEANQYYKTSILRLGIVLHPQGGYLKEIKKPVRFGASYIGSPERIQSWIGLKDLLRLIQHIFLTSQPKKIYHAVSPSSISARELHDKICQHYQGLNLFPLPAFLAKAFFKEKAALMLHETNAIPRNAISEQFFFEQPSLRKLFSSFHSLY